MTRGAVVGIDLGTTYSLVATMANGSPVVLANELGERLLPSAVSVADDGTILVGAPARARAATAPERTALWFKRDMGTARELTLGSRKFRPEQLSALVLGELKRTVEASLGQPIEEAVITVPAYFGELQRRATRDAAEIAGIRAERIINEPTAAALAYGLHQKDRELRAVVLDLGGGTFDVTVLEIIEGVVEIQASAGDVRLGGEDFADALTTWAAGRLRQDHRLEVESGTVLWARLRETCETAKRRLSTADSACIALSNVGSARDVELSITREEAEALWQPLLSRLEKPIQRALQDAGIPRERIDEVLLVGGATRMPCLARVAFEKFGRPPSRALPPDEAVAIGAAVQAALKSGDAAVEDMVVTDVAPFTLGIEVSEHLADRFVTGLYAPILERGTVLPASRVKQFSTVQDGQRILEVKVFQGEHSLVRDNTHLGSYRVTGIPSAAAGEEHVDVRFTYDLNGILEVDATVCSTNEKHSLVIERSPGRLSREDVEKAREAMKRLKFHPRDALPNVTALARGDALYAELSGDARAQLGHCLTAFRLALEGQDRAEIDARRGILVEAIDALGRAQAR
jgi:molecular chaperone HscC